MTDRNVHRTGEFNPPEFCKSKKPPRGAQRFLVDLSANWLEGSTLGLIDRILNAGFWLQALHRGAHFIAT